MKVLVDTNVLIDALAGREPYFEYADAILRMSAENKIEGYMAAHSIPNMFYILRKDLSVDERKEVLLNLCDILSVEGIDSEKIMASLKNRSFTDFEDCLQEQCAVAIQADYIITRNIKDFANAKVKAVEPEMFINMMDQLEKGQNNESGQI